MQEVRIQDINEIAIEIFQGKYEEKYVSGTVLRASTYIILFSTVF